MWRVGRWGVGVGVGRQLVLVDSLRIERCVAVVEDVASADSVAGDH